MPMIESLIAMVTKLNDEVAHLKNNNAEFKLQIKGS
jgi:hypothetical protein